MPPTSRGEDPLPAAVPAPGSAGLTPPPGPERPAAAPEPGAGRSVRLPPANLAERPLPERTLGTDVAWWRVHPGAYGPVHFGRHPGHRFSPPGAWLAVCYLGESVAACLLEIFGDELLDQAGATHRLALARWESRCATELCFRRPLRVCDLTTAAGLVAAGSDLASLLEPTLRAPQAWAEAIMRHPATVDGLLYPSRFGGGTALALFGRDDTAAALAPGATTALSDSGPAAEFLRRYEIALI